ncbi:MAG: pentapeptide repeat-containing protein [Bauldia sp.]|nr:pentapeptide repeat-containing protein [Bauldia sp.]
MIASRRLAPVAVLLVLLRAGSAMAQEGAAIDVEPSVWDLVLGSHASELPTDQFVDFACGTNGGPPSRLIGSWTDYALCNVEAQTGWREVYFQYDDLYEFVALARSDEYRAALYRYTSVYSRPVIATALFDDDGFMRGLRLVTDPRVSEMVREQAYQLGGFIQSRYSGDWQCEDLPPLEGETPFRGVFIKRICTLEDGDVSRTVETHVYRRPGQRILNPDNLPTQGYYESYTRSEEFLTGDIDDREERLAAIAERPPPEEDPLVVRARDCPGCDLSGAILRRADLRNANLAGANLEGASFHAANLAGANLEGANLTNANLNRALLMQANLSGATLSGVMLYQARLDGANLSNAIMPGTLAGRARLIRADLSGAVANDSDFTSILMTNATAVGANFGRSRFWDAQLSRTDFTGAIFDRSDLLNANLTGIVFVDGRARIARIVGVDLRDSNLADADFSGSSLEGAILARAILDGANFEGTILPAGFAPPRPAEQP